MRRRPAPPRDPARLDGGRIQRVLSELGYDLRSPALQLLRVWEQVAGPELARSCEPTDWQGATLELTVTSPVWAQEVSLRKPLLLAALRRELGDSAPTEIRTRVR